MSSYCFDAPKATLVTSLAQRGALLAPRCVAFGELDANGNLWEETYADLVDDIAVCGCWLRQLLKVDECNDGNSLSRVALLGENSYVWVVAFFACVGLGMTVVVLDPTSPEGRLRQRVKECHCMGILCTPAYQSLAENIALEAGQFSVICLGMLGKDGPAWRATRCFGNLAQCSPSGIAFDSAMPRRGYSIWYSSGTCGDGRGVLVSQENLLCDLEGSIQRIRFSSNDVFLSVLPISHLYEFMGSVLCSLRCLARTYFCASLTKLRRCMAVCKPTVMMCVPQQVEFLSQEISGTSSSGAAWTRGRTSEACASGDGIGAYSSLHMLICGGSPLKESDVSGLRGLGIQVVQGYGASECSPVIAVGGSPLTGDLSVGKPLGCAQVSIDSGGQIVVRGPIVASKYVSNDSGSCGATSSLHDGVFFSGDIGHFDEAGNLYVDGRLDDSIPLENGQVINPYVIEKRIESIPCVERAIVRGEHSESHPLQLVAYVWPRENSQGFESYSDEAINMLREALLRLNGSMEPSERIWHLVLVKCPVECTPLGKVRRAALSPRVGIGVEV